MANYSEQQPVSRQQPADFLNDARYHSASDRLLLFARGLAMGLADSVPGVSGATIAVITNIYDQVIYSLRAIDHLALRKVLQGNFKQAWQHINGSYLLLLALGMLTGLLLSANTVLFLLDNHVEALMGFFSGLVIASCVLLLPQVSFNRGTHWAGISLGLALTVGLGLLEPISGEPGPGMLFISGAIAISAMLLPGLSGAFILLLLGVYETMLKALVEIQWLPILVFAAGCGCGLLVFSRVLAWLLRHYHQRVYSVIIGMLLGSLTVLWPWQRGSSAFPDADGLALSLQSRLVLPLNYTEATGQQPQVLLVVLALLGGVAAVTLLQRVFARKQAADGQSKTG